MALTLHADVRYGLPRLHAKHPPVSVRTRRLALVMLMSILALLGLGVGLYEVFSEHHSWGLLVAPNSSLPGTWRVLDNEGLDPVIAPGDVIVRVDGHSPKSADDINQAQTLEVRIPGKSVVYRTIWQAGQFRDFPLEVSWIVLGCFCFLLGVLVFLHATERSLALRFFWLMITLSGSALLIPAFEYSDTLLQTVSQSLAGGLFFGFLVNFLWLLLRPRPPLPMQADSMSSEISGVQPRQQWWPTVFIVLGALLAILNFIAYAWHLPMLQTNNGWAGYIIDGIEILLCCGLLLTVGFARQPSLARERARILLGGVLIAILPLLIFTILPAFLFKATHDGRWSSLAIVLVLPLTFAFALMRRQLLHLDSLVHKTAVVLLVAQGAVFTSVPLISLLSSLPPLQMATIAVIAEPVLLLVLYYTTRWLTETWLFPQVRQYRQLIAKGDVPSQKNDPVALAEQLTSEVKLHLPVRHLALFVLDRTTSIFLPVTSDGASLLMDETALNALKRLQGPVLVEPYRIDRHTTPKIGELVPALPNQDPALLGQFPRWHVLTPLGTQDLIGILALGPREDGQPYSGTDLRLLRYLAGRRSMALAYLLNFEKLRMDLEERREHEHLRQSVLQGTQSHLLEPLSALQQHLEALRAGQEDEIGRKETTQVIQQLSEQMATIVTGMRAWQMALSPAGSPPLLEQRIVNVTEEVQQVVWRLQARATERQIQIRARVAANLIAVGDVAVIRQILERLLMNAINASQPGGRVDLSVHQQSNEPPSGAVPSGNQTESVAPAVEVIVRDRGTSIPQQMLPFLFDWFSGERLAQRQGLPLVGESIRLLGGTIWVESDELAQSCAFHVVLPVTRESRTVAHSTEHAFPRYAGRPD